MECEYCDEEFSRDVDLHRHWLADHREELTGHEKDTAKRTVKKHERRSESSTDYTEWIRPMAIAGIIILTLAGLGYGATQTGIIEFGVNDIPTYSGSIGAAGSSHHHLTFEVVVEGNRIDFSQPQYQVQDNRAHFEGGDGTTLHMHATGVPLSYVFSTFGWTLDANQTVIQGNTYSPDQVEVTINGATVPLHEAADYVPQEGDGIRVTVG